MKRAEETVGQSGLYRIHHQGHRPTHEAILWRGETFPSCRICREAAKFQFVRPVRKSEEFEHIGYDRDFMESVLRGGEPSCPQLSA